jgi:cyclic pyranopterin phosphate synthase
MKMARMSHLDRSGKAKMVDVGAKRASRRRAVARGRVLFNARAFAQLRDNRLAKGDALAVARLAGIQAAKRTADWIPLCHSVPLDHVDVSIELNEEKHCAVVSAESRARWTTGVEMEALVAVSAACLALYDMAKAVDRGITVTDVQLLLKEGGKAGRWARRGSGYSKAAP